MPDAGCLVIDDVEASLSRASDVGRAILCESAESVRTAVTRFAHRRRWTIVPYRAYSAWANDTRRQSPGQWMVADPLFGGDAGEQQFAYVRSSRSSSPSEPLRFDSASRAVSDNIRPGSLGIIDDAVSSGRTMAQLIRAAGECDASVSDVLVCASSRMARDALKASRRDLRWRDFIPGDWRVVHLRDGCAHLPFSARPTGRADIDGGSGTRVEVRIQPTLIAGNLWQVMWLDREVRAAIRAACSDVANKLGAMLNRTAVVRDLSLLGDAVPALCTGQEVITADTSLASLIPVD